MHLIMLLKTHHYTVGFIKRTCMYSRAQQSSKFIRTKESVYIRKELNSNSIGLVHQHLGWGYSHIWAIYM